MGGAKVVIVVLITACMEEGLHIPLGNVRNPREESDTTPPTKRAGGRRANSPNSHCSPTPTNSKWEPQIQTQNLWDKSVTYMN